MISAPVAEISVVPVQLLKRQSLRQCDWHQRGHKLAQLWLQLWLLCVFNLITSCRSHAAGLMAYSVCHYTLVLSMISSTGHTVAMGIVHGLLA
jgi:hypothetical protein